VVGMVADPLRIFAEPLSKQVPCDPFGILPQNLMSDVLEQIELKRIARAISRFDSINDTSPHTVNEVAIKETDRLAQLAVHFSLPFPLLVEVEIARRHAAAGLTEQMER